MRRKGFSRKGWRIQELFGAWMAQGPSAFRSRDVWSLPKDKRGPQQTFTLSVPSPPRKRHDFENQGHPAIALDGGARHIGDPAVIQFQVLGPYLLLAASGGRSEMGSPIPGGGWAKGASRPAGRPTDRVRGPRPQVASGALRSPQVRLRNTTSCCHGSVPMVRTSPVGARRLCAKSGLLSSGTAP